MNQLVENFASGISAVIYYIKAFVTLAVSNPWFLGLTALMFISRGKSLKLGKVFSVRG